MADTQVDRYKEKHLIAQEFIDLGKVLKDRHIMQAALDLDMTYNTVKRRLSGHLGAHISLDRALLNNLKNMLKNEQTAIS